VSLQLALLQTHILMIGARRPSPRTRPALDPSGLERLPFGPRTRQYTHILFNGAAYGGGGCAWVPAEVEIFVLIFNVKNTLIFEHF